jgi:hypothetical protein
LALALAIVLTTVALLAHVWRVRQLSRRRRTTGAPPPVPHAFGSLARRVRMTAGSGVGGSQLGAEASPHSDVAPRLRAALRRRRATPTGVIAKHCPRCGSRYDLAVSHCEKDGVELRTLN